MGFIRSVARRVDRFQERRPWVAFPYAVLKKFGDDDAGNLAALIAYYGFFSLFPLLLVFTAMLGILVRGNAALQDRLLHSAVAGFPVIGTQIERNIGSLNRGSSVALVIGIAGTLWSGLGVIKAVERALDAVWNVPRRERPNAVFATLRALFMLGILGVITVVSATVSGVASGSGIPWRAAAGVGASLGLNFAAFVLAFRFLTSADVSWSDVRPGAAVAATVWTGLEAAGGFIVGHQIRTASDVYGIFAIVIGLLAWLYLGAQVTLFAAEVNVVKKRRLWPRRLEEPPPSADPQSSEARDRGARKVMREAPRETAPARGPGRGP
ncbi:MAG: YihY/virulence factor BrkB family protein, partial [Actinomycetota bacterium]|nr:YihY/virulence factor BrkB family protein [Actinomycetota bacterium]